MLGSRAGMLRFLLGRNDKIWAALTQEEKKIVLDNNARHNTIRPDYADPTLYQGGSSFDAPIDPHNIVQNHLAAFLFRNNPCSVLEIGPGSGHLTRLIVSHQSVSSYTGLDINKAFLDFLHPRLSAVKAARADFNFSLICGDVNEINFGEQKFEAIVVLSAIHHIPDRTALFKKFEGLLEPGGKIFTYEPAHYIPRILYLRSKFKEIYGKQEYWSVLKNYGTHHFCTLEEFQAVANDAELEIDSCYFYRINFPFPKLIRKIITSLLKIAGMTPQADGTYEVSSSKSLLRFFADRMIFVFKKN